MKGEHKVKSFLGALLIFQEAMEAKYQQLKSLVDNLSVDVEKLMKQNKSAGIRIRKAMLDVKNLAQDIRKDILESKKS